MTFICNIFITLGIISVPVNFKLPVGGASTFSKALDAKVCNSV
jgi:hypothetical protein